MATTSESRILQAAGGYREGSVGEDWERFVVTATVVSEYGEDRGDCYGRDRIQRRVVARASGPSPRGVVSPQAG